MNKTDFKSLFTPEIRNLNLQEYKEYLKRKLLFDANFCECFVSVNENNRPVFIQWVMYPEEQGKIDKVFDKGIAKLEQNEVLLEGAYTHPDYRNMDIMSETLELLEQKIADKNIKFIVTYVQENNFPSLKALQNAGFFLDKYKVEVWRLFRKKSIYQPLKNHPI